MKKGYRIVSAVLAMCMILVLMPAIKVNAAEKVRVGYFQISGYQEIAQDGTRRGFGYDYLQEIAKYTGWEYEYVDATWDECLNMLAEGEIDLLTCAKYSEERAQLYDFSTCRMGLLHSVITVRTDDDRYSYDDYAGFDGMKVGILKGNRTNQTLERLCEEHSIQMELCVFGTEKELKDALENKEIDAIASSNQRVLENEKVICRFGLGEFYAVTAKGNDELLVGLNTAMERIVLDNPYYEAELYDKYFANNAGYKVAFTAQEKHYIQEKGSIKAVVMPDAEPFSFYDGEKYQGIAVESIEAIAAEAGLQVEYVQAKDGAEAMQMLQNQEADVIADFYADYSWGQKQGAILTKPYMEMPYAEVTAGQKAEAGERKVAVCADSFFNEIYVQEYYPAEQIIYFDSERACVEAVRSGEADVAYVSQYAAEILLQEDENLKLDSRILYETVHGVAIAVAEQERTLCYILDKAITNLEAEKIPQIIEEYKSMGEEKVSLRRFIYYNPIPVIISMAVVFSVVIGALVYALIQKKKYDQHIFELAYKDPLSGLGNINLLEDFVVKKRQEYLGKDVAMISLDINHFTTINESYGREVGDLVIGHVGYKLKEMIADKGMVVRNKADNFLLFGIYSDDEIKKLVEQIQSELGNYQCKEAGVGEEGINISYYFGIVKAKFDGDTSLHQMIDRAAMAKKATKREKSIIWYFDDEMEQQLLREKMLEDRMESALENGEFTVYYQPKFRMSDNEVIGAEALIRWNSKEYGFMNPGEFVPLFESNGFILELDFYCMEQVYKMLRARLDAGQKAVRVSINQSRMHFGQKNYIARLNALREKYQIPNELIELELTESIFADMQDISRGVEELKANGYHLSVDDFGSGYSSLNMIKEIPIDTLKIDRDFLSDDEQESGRYQKVIRKVVELAKELNMSIICEGVEKEEQADFLQSVGCMYAQGFLYAKPMPEQDFLDLLEEKPDDK